MDHGARVGRFGDVSTALGLMGDRRLAELVGSGMPVGRGIGGTTLLLEVDGTPVFVKRVPLTDLERRPEHVRSTANLFGLPVFYQYGVGSTGFGAWRELAAHTMTTNWVLTGRCPSFPLTYHWRVLEMPARSLPDSELETDVTYWAGSAAVRARLEAIRDATASVVLFLEYLPRTLSAWLAEQVAAGTADAACAMVERELGTAVAAMNAGGLVHFDAHFGNVLTDGHGVYLADFGLATSPRFELSVAEADFLRANDGHDGALAVMLLVDWLVTAVCGVPRTERDAYVLRCADGAEPAGAPAWAAGVIRRGAPVAAVLNTFYGRLQRESRTIPFPDLPLS